MAWTPAVKQLAIKAQGHPAAFADGPEWTDALVLAAGVAQNYSLTTLRANAGLAAGAPVFLEFAANGPFWIHYHGEVNVAAVPVANKLDGSSPDYSPTQGYFNGSFTQFSILAPAATVVVLKAYKT